RASVLAGGPGGRGRPRTAGPAGRPRPTPEQPVRPVRGPVRPAGCQTHRITSNADAKQWTAERIDVRIDAEPGGSAPLGLPGTGRAAPRARARPARPGPAR